MITVRRKPTNVPSIFDMFDDMWMNNLPAVNKVSGFKPAVNVSDYEKHFQLDFAAPGFDKKDFNVAIEKERLTVSVNKEVSKEEKSDNVTRREFSFGNFERTFTLPETVDIDKIEAQYENGILHVFLPKKEEAAVEAKKLIEIK